jgi:hypothetical protein
MRPVLFVCGGIALLAVLTQYLYRHHKRLAAARSAQSIPTARGRSEAPPSAPVPVGAVEQRSS